ncbi:YodC family protein [Methylomonas sp. BW4-1]|uniref:YodC family protein n=1 Tax=Methylomonas sp. BW4-1 TaxID=3376685 RepID=UPI00404221B9
MDFNKGDVVALKSGGPKMTVTGVVGGDAILNVTKVQGYSDGDVSVEYFHQDKLEKAMFKKTSLVLAKD